MAFPLEGAFVALGFNGTFFASEKNGVVVICFSSFAVLISAVSAVWATSKLMMRHRAGDRALRLAYQQK